MLNVVAIKPKEHYAILNQEIHDAARAIYHRFAGNSSGPWIVDRWKALAFIEALKKQDISPVAYFRQIDVFFCCYCNRWQTGCSLDDNDAYVCSECAKNHDVCEICGRVTANAEALHRQIVCPDCHFCAERCERCDSWTLPENMEDVDGEQWCESCVFDDAVECVNCDALTRDDQFQIEVGTYCPQCASEFLFSCVNCAELYDYRENGATGECCPTCARQEVPDEILRAGWQEQRERMARRGDPNETIGLEIECENVDLDRLADLKADLYRSPLVLSVKDDGSLDDSGIEIVLQPASYAYMMQSGFCELASILNTASKYGARAWRHESCGIHAHITREALSPLSHLRIVRFSENAEDEWQEHIGRRSGRQYCQYFYRGKAFTTHCRRSRKRPYTDRRYVAVNLSNWETIELRIWQSTLNVNAVRAVYEFCEACRRWLPVAGNEPDWSDFCNWLNDQPFTRLKRQIVATGGPDLGATVKQEVA